MIVRSAAKALTSLIFSWCRQSIALRARVSTPSETYLCFFSQSLSADAKLTVSTVYVVAV